MLMLVLLQRLFQMPAWCWISSIEATCVTWRNENVISITYFSITHFDLPKPILRKLSTGARKITVLKISLNNSTPGLLNSKLIAFHWLDWLKLILRILRSSYLNSNSGFVICWTVQNLELFNKILNKKESFSARNM